MCFFLSISRGVCRILQAPPTQLKRSKIINSINHHIKQPFLNNHFGESNQRVRMLLFVGDYIQEKDGKKKEEQMEEKNKIYSYPTPP
jgi:hypothetical protein